jgi:hypothetical protein
MYFITLVAKERPFPWHTSPLMYLCFLPDDDDRMERLKHVIGKYMNEHMVFKVYLFGFKSLTIK